MGDARGASGVGGGLPTSASATRSPQSTTPLRYLPALDGLRSVAVILVVIHHLHPGFGGWTGVDIFLVLSGFLITRLLVIEYGTTGRIHLVLFYLRRLLRLYPPLIVVVLALWPLGMVASHDSRRFSFETLAALGYFSNIAQTVSQHPFFLWGHTWTLALEEQFYLVWPLFLIVTAALALAPRTQRFAMVVAAAGTMSLLEGGLRFDPHGLNFNPLLTCGGLLTGCALALTCEHWLPRAGNWAAAVGVATIAVAVVMGSTGGSVHGWAVPAAVFGALLIVSHLAKEDRTSLLVRALSWRPAVFIGGISYEIYLWHLPLIVLTPHLGRVPDPVTKLLMMMLVLAAAYLSKRYVSAPLNHRFKPRLARIEGAPMPLPADAG